MQKFSRPILAMAPMAGITDSVCRQIVKLFGAEITYTEMISSRGIFYKDEKTGNLLSFEENERPIIVQLFGNSPEIMAYAAACIEPMGFNGIDINMGCPTPKIAGNGDGCALMRDIDLAGRICTAVANAVKLPVSVKFRKGWDEKSLNGVEFAKAMQNCGASSITVHARTGRQQFTGAADTEYAALVKQAVSIPVTVSGDIFCGADALKVYEMTKCDGLMIGRGALGNPWIFKEIRAVFDGIPFSGVTAKERIDMALFHARALCGYKGERMGILESRKFSSWYLKGIKNAAKLRNRINEVNSLSALEKLLGGTLDTNETDGVIIG